MKALILTEGGKGIGFGHLTRCSAIYDAFLNAGVMTEFLINNTSSVKMILENRSYSSFNWFKEKNKTGKYIQNADIVLIDSYLIDINFCRWILHFDKTTAYLDDYNRLKYPVGIIINGSIGAKKLGYRKNSVNKYLLGPRYAYLRSSFTKLDQRPLKKRIKSILVTFGGSDTFGITYKILKFLREKYPLLKKNVIVTKNFKHFSKIRKLHDETTDIINQPNACKMAHTMLVSDIAISAGGQTLYELARCGIPTIGICVAVNQKANLMGWEKAGFIKNIGWYNAVDILEKIVLAINEFKDIKNRLLRSKKAINKIDGNGANRIVNFLVEYTKIN